MIRQYPIVTEERFMEALAALTDNDTFQGLDLNAKLEDIFGQQ